MATNVGMSIRRTRRNANKYDDGAAKLRKAGFVFSNEIRTQNDEASPIALLLAMHPRTTIRPGDDANKYDGGCDATHEYIQASKGRVRLL